MHTGLPWKVVRQAEEGPRLASRKPKQLFFFQAEDGIRDLVRSRGLGDVYKRQFQNTRFKLAEVKTEVTVARVFLDDCIAKFLKLSLIHI